MHQGFSLESQPSNACSRTGDGRPRAWSSTRSSRQVLRRRLPTRSSGMARCHRRRSWSVEVPGIDGNADSHGDSQAADGRADRGNRRRPRSVACPSHGHPRRGAPGIAEREVQCGHRSSALGDEPTEGGCWADATQQRSRETETGQAHEHTVRPASTETHVHRTTRAFVPRGSSSLRCGVRRVSRTVRRRTRW